MYGEVVARLDCYIGIRMHAEVIEMHAIGYRYRYYIVLLAVHYENKLHAIIHTWAFICIYVE